MQPALWSRSLTFAMVFLIGYPEHALNVSLATVRNLVLPYADETDPNQSDSSNWVMWLIEYPCPWPGWGGVHPCSKVIGIFSAMPKSGTQIQNTDLQLCELYHEMFWNEQVKYCYISFVRLVYAVV